MEFKELLPYIITVVCSLIAGISSYLASRKSIKAEIATMEKQHTLDIEKEREKFSMEKERIEIEHKNQLEMMQKEVESKKGVDLVNTMFSEVSKYQKIDNK